MIKRSSLVLILTHFVLLQFALMTNSTAQSTYDRDFDGVGPRVYHLPPPPSEAELLSRQIERKLEETIALPKMLSKATALNDLRNAGNSSLNVALLAGDRQSAEGWLLMEIDRLSQLGDWDQIGDLYLLLGREYFRIGAMELAHANLEKALSSKIAVNKYQDVMQIRNSLALLYEYADDLYCAKTLYTALMEEARQRNNRLLQARAQMRLAFLKAKEGNFYEAEQDLIRSVEPMYRQMRNRSGDLGRIVAYRTLADVYRLQDRHPEAQWFLLQAKEVIDTKNLEEFLPLILFDLAEVKKSSGNTRVAIDEYLLAAELSGDQTDDLVLKLAIQDALGDIYHGSGQFKEALEALNRFDTLKAKLISLDFPF